MTQTLAIVFLVVIGLGVVKMVFDVQMAKLKRGITYLVDRLSDYFEPPVTKEVEVEE